MRCDSNDLIFFFDLDHFFCQVCLWKEPLVALRIDLTALALFTFPWLSCCQHEKKRASQICVQIQSQVKTVDHMDVDAHGRPRASTSMCPRRLRLSLSEAHPCCERTCRRVFQSSAPMMMEPGSVACPEPDVRHPTMNVGKFFIHKHIWV